MYNERYFPEKIMVTVKFHEDCNCKIWRKAIADMIDEDNEQPNDPSPFEKISFKAGMMFKVFILHDYKDCVDLKFVEDAKLRKGMSPKYAEVSEGDRAYKIPKSNLLVNLHEYNQMMAAQIAESN